MINTRPVKAGNLSPFAYFARNNQIGATCQEEVSGVLPQIGWLVQAFFRKVFDTSEGIGFHEMRRGHRRWRARRPRGRGPAEEAGTMRRGDPGAGRPGRQGWVHARVSHSRLGMCPDEVRPPLVKARFCLGRTATVCVSPPGSASGSAQGGEFSFALAACRSRLPDFPWIVSRIAQGQSFAHRGRRIRFRLGWGQPAGAILGFGVGPGGFFGLGTSR